MSVMKGTVRLTVLMTIARDIIGKNVMKGTSIVEMLVTHTLIVNICFLPRISNRKPNSKQLKESEIMVVSKMIYLNPNTRFTESMRNITKS
jgi:hypothetical protein